MNVLTPSVLNFSKLSSDSPRFSVESEVPGYTLSLTDEKFLNYAAATIDIFSPDAMANPRYWYKKINVSQRVSVSRVKLILVKDVANPIGFAVNPKTAQLWGKGGYDVKGDTLIVRIALDTDALNKAGKADATSLEDVFLNTAIKTMYYAKGKVDPEEDRRVFGQLKVDMDQYLYKTGVFIWPVRIERKNT